MKEEVLRLDRVTCLDQGATALNHFSLSVFAGEIMGLVPVNSTGLETLLQLLRQNIPLHYGYVYYREKLINHWQHADGQANRISIIGASSGLADDLTVADNVFVLRPGFGKHIIHRGVLRRQLAPFLQATGVDISADARVRDLTGFQRFVVALVKAVVAGHRLIVLIDVGTIVSDAELHQLHAILRHWAAEGISFLYVSQHYEEIREVCARAALMVSGQIAKILDTAQTPPEAIQSLGVEHFERMVRTQRAQATPDQDGVPALEVKGLHYGMIDGLSLSIAPGECVVLQDLDNHMLDDLIAVMTGGAHPDAGSIQVAGKRFARAGLRDVATIQKLATKTMLFPDMSYEDNLCFMMDHHLRRVWLSRRGKRSVRRECEAWLGADVFDTPVEALTQMQKYDLIYARVMLQRPKVVFCVQPFMQADVAQRMHIWQLLERLLQRGIAVVILAVNLADTLSLADRLIRVQNGRVLATYVRGDFGALPEDAPWRHLWHEAAAQAP